MSNPTKHQSWNDLINIANEYRYDLEDAVFDENVQGGGLSIDFRLAGITDKIRDKLILLACDQKLEEWRNKMFSGDAINTTENRAVLHTDLRSGKNDDVLYELDRIETFVNDIRGSNQFTDIVHIGIGGSYLGPQLVCNALSHLPSEMNMHFVSNVDAADIRQTLNGLNPETTMFLIASKTFTTQETMMNAHKARQWLGDLPIAKHVVALSTNTQAVEEFGIDPNCMFPFWDWVGGRFSVWSCIGMPIALKYGFDVFKDFLNGGHDMDKHFKESDLQNNLPVLMAMNGVWNRNFLKRPAYTVLPYAQNLSGWCDFLQQLDMESNGKSIDRDGEKITSYQTGPIVFGQPGTNGQHAFHQWLHQGTDIVPAEFIRVDNLPYDDDHATVLNAHGQAQAHALANGKINLEEPHRSYTGERPSVTIYLPDLSAHSIGTLIALYEHKIFVQGVIWNINSFDQWGVELGKEMAQLILESDTIKASNSLRPKSI